MPSSKQGRRKAEALNGHRLRRVLRKVIPVDGFDPGEAHLTCGFEAVDTTVETLSFGKESGKQAEKLKANAFQKARRWSRHWFVASILQLRQAFFNYGFTLTAADKKDRDKLKAWKTDAKSEKMREWIADYTDDLWSEWLLLENVISFWRNASERPVLLNLEDCEYSDAFGSELLCIKHNLTTEQINKLKGWSEEEKKRLRAKNVLEIGPDDELFHFKVSKRARAGLGLGWPSFMGIFEALGQGESLEVGDAIMAFAGRTVWEQHKIGHEVTAGVMAGTEKFHYNKKHADAFIKACKGKSGHHRVTTPFDHEISFPRVDPKNFDAARYASVIERLRWWSQPLAQMIDARGITPYLLRLLKMQARPAREKMGRHLTQTLNEVFEPPCRVLPAWSNHCFVDERLASDLLKAGLAAGPISQTTFAEEAGYDPELERERKTVEAGLPKAETYPIWDAAHGVNPVTGEMPGKPPGTQDKG